MYTYLLVFIFVLFVHYNTKLSVSASSSPRDNRYFRIRNSLLRIYIAGNKTKPKQIMGKTKKPKKIEKPKKTEKKFTTHFYKKIENKCNEISIFYNNLTDEEKDLIDFIVTLYY